MPHFTHKSLSTLGTGALASLLVLTSLACDGNLPEITPGPLSRPTKIETHGPIQANHYRGYDGPRTINYVIFEVNGTTIRVEDGYAQEAIFPKVKGVNAVGFRVRGKAGAAGIYVLQVDGANHIVEKICPYGTPGIWKGTTFWGCEFSWDTQKMKRIRTPKWDD